MTLVGDPFPGGLERLVGQRLQSDHAVLGQTVDGWNGVSGQPNTLAYLSSFSCSYAARLAFRFQAGAFRGFSLDVALPTSWKDVLRDSLSSHPANDITLIRIDSMCGSITQKDPPDVLRLAILTGTLLIGTTH